MIKISKTYKNLAIFLLLFGLFYGLSACKKDYIDWAKLQQDEINARENYLRANYETIDITEDGNTHIGLIIENDTIEPTASGLYYIPTEEGTGLAPTAGRMVQVKYEGKLLNDTVFDSSEKFSFTYGAGKVIAGWDEALSYMKKGGKAHLIIPSSLAYGSNESGDIPRYSTLLFDIELLNVQ